MLKSHEKFHSVNGKRQILIADDEFINREILAEMLKEDYDLLFACDGQETIDAIRANRSTLSLVLLDILMPVKSGLDVLREVKEDAELAKIPVIVMTAERDSEIESLELGAIDFIPKPYPAVGVIQARLRRTIELTEDRDIIQSTERDPLTGLYNKEYFYRYVQQFDQYHGAMDMDAVILDINHFHMINERYGKAYGDGVLQQLAKKVQEMVRTAGGFICRREADTFMVYAPHREDYPQVIEEAMTGLQDVSSAENRVRLRMGVYPHVDKSIDVEQRFDRAKMAADTVKDTFSESIGYYDETLHKKQLYAEQLIEEFPRAIAERQFQVYYQPKFDIRPDTPVLTSAEALIRWVHPTLGMISPGEFIPLFEENGLIRRLDHYVWQETARQIRDWKDRLLYAIPVSVNVSRIDMFDADLPKTLEGILAEQGISSKDLLLEVTESAYTQDAQQIIRMVETLRECGFQIEMDDFGTGYSSLHMISSLPIDALKLDMHFVRDAFAGGGNTHMLEVIIGIAAYLGVPVIAEGVENQEQLHALKKLGCDIVQGYFFSRPVPAEVFEAFILQKKEADLALAEKEEERPGISEDDADAMARRIALTEMEEEIGEKLTRRIDSREEEESAAGSGPQSSESAPQADVPARTAGTGSEENPGGIPLKRMSLTVFIAAVVAAAAVLITDVFVTNDYQRMKEASERYVDAELAASNLEFASDYLTDRVRCFVMTGETVYMDDFCEEVSVTRRRDAAVDTLTELLEGVQSNAPEQLNTALSLSNELVDIENRAIRLAAASVGMEASDIPEEIAAVELTQEELSMSAEALQNKAQELVFDDTYVSYKDQIRENVDQCAQSLMRASSSELTQATDLLSFLVRLQAALVLILLLVIIVIVVLLTRLVRVPLSNMVQKMHEQKPIDPTGVQELQYVTLAYNRMLAENKAAQEKLSHEASHDALTGLFNRGAYDLWMESADTEHIALILIDVDHFKEVNDTYGHAVGDRVLQRVAETLRGRFRSVDILCRIGGDEFAVIMTRVNSSMRALVSDKIAMANDILQHPEDDLPPVSLSVGVAFADRKNPQGDIFKDADAALYRVKEAGRNGCRFY